jgi:hypothetical protein
VSIAKCFTRPVLLAVAAATGAAGIPTAAAAQVVRGVVVDAASGRTLPGTVVVLMDSSGKRVAGVLSGDDGAYAIRVAAPGRYAVRAERIGFRADAATPLTVAVGQTVELRLATRPIPVVLGAVKVTGRTACVARASDGRDLSAVWDEVRKALYATDLTQRQELFTATLTRFQRTLDPRSRRVIAYESQDATAMTRSPFVSVPAAQLSAEGFVRQVAGESVYYAPDAGVLLSDEFLGDHCFRLRNGAGRRSEQIGIQFEPVRGREKPDIEGTLWVDRKTAELSDLEFTYRNLPALPSDANSEDFGGRAEFHRMPSGAWIVERWLIRLPVLVDKGRLARRDPTVPGNAGSVERIQLAAIREEGGEVTETSARGTQRGSTRQVASVRGVVFDSTRMAPLRDARVFLDGTQFSARTGEDGSFVIEQVPPGDYSLSATHARFDSVDARVPAANVTLRAGEETAARLAGPSVATVLARDCTAYERTAGGAMLRGHVRDGVSGAPAPDARVTLTWTRLEVRATGVSERTAVTRTDAAGRYTFCALPDGVRLTARVAFDGRRSAPLSMSIREGELSVLDLAVGTDAIVAAADPPPAPALASAPVTARNRAMQEYDRRRRRGNGSFLTRAQIDRSNASRLSDLLRRMPTVAILPSDNGALVIELRGSKRVSFAPAPVQQTDSGSTTRAAPAQGTSQMSVQNCPAAILLDGMAIDGGASLDAEMGPGTLEAIEVYPPAQVPIEYAGRYSECGVVMIWTRSFADRPNGAPGT